MNARAPRDPARHRPRRGRVLAAIGAALLVLLVSTAAAATYLYRQATALPDWYDPDAPEATLGPDADAGELEGEGGLVWETVSEPSVAPPGVDRPADPAPASEDEQAKVPDRAKRRRKRAVMKNFHLRAMAKDPVLERATRTSRAEYHDGKLEAGAVLDMDRIQRKDLSPENRSFYDRATRAFPALRKKQVYLALEDEPVTRDGFLQLGDAPRVRIGNLSYSLEGAARRVGMSPAKLRKEIDRELRRLKVRDPTLPPPELDEPPVDGPI